MDLLAATQQGNQGGMPVGNPQASPVPGPVPGVGPTPPGPTLPPELLKIILPLLLQLIMAKQQGQGPMPTGQGPIPSFAYGTPYVPQTGTALLHQGEAVTPASQNPLSKIPPDLLAKMPPEMQNRFSQYIAQQGTTPAAPPTMGPTAMPPITPGPSIGRMPIAPPPQISTPASLSAILGGPGGMGAPTTATPNVPQAPKPITPTKPTGSQEKGPYGGSEKSPFQELLGKMLAMNVREKVQAGTPIGTQGSSLGGTPGAPSLGGALGVQKPSLVDLLAQGMG